jgi:NAD(P)-dependent dehydrogenase (short-subunit alcohol dehydrogenase family)
VQQVHGDQAGNGRLMEALGHEVWPFGICAALVEPGPIKAPFRTRPQPTGIDA